MQSESENNTFKNDVARAKKTCSSRERTESEVSGMLHEWGMDDDQVAEIISLLKSEKYIDDTRYISSFINDRVKFQKWGMIKIRYALSGKGLSPELISRGIEEFDNEEYTSMIKSELTKKHRTLKGTPSEIKQKLLRFGFSRGYESNVIYKIADELLK